MAIRGGTEPVPESAAGIIAAHRDVDGQLLTPRVAAVELLNILRPTVAPAVYITFVGHALEAQPSWRKCDGTTPSSPPSLLSSVRSRTRSPSCPRAGARQ